VRVILDTNVLISALLAFARSGAAIDETVTAAIRGQYTLLVPEEIIAELQEARAKKPFLIQAIPEGMLQRFISLLRDTAEVIPFTTGPIPAVLRDQGDDFLLTASATGNADYLVTGDRDLLDIRDRLSQPRILTVTEFLDLLATIER
jgi:hypothetical protein